MEPHVTELFEAAMLSRLLEWRSRGVARLPMQEAAVAAVHFSGIEFNGEGLGLVSLIILVVEMFNCRCAEKE